MNIDDFDYGKGFIISISDSSEHCPNLLRFSTILTEY